MFDTQTSQLMATGKNSNHVKVHVQGSMDNDIDTNLGIYEKKTTSLLHIY